MVLYQMPAIGFLSFVHSETAPKGIKNVWVCFERKGREIFTPRIVGIEKQSLKKH